MNELLRPRRFAEVWQVHYIYRGSEEQQRAVRDSLIPSWDTNHHRLLQRLDRAVNATKRSHLTIEFHNGMNTPGTASPAGFSLSAAMGYHGVWEVARHELGHVVDFWLLTDEHRVWFMKEMGRESWPGAWESWAEAVREWMDGGWPSLTPILLP